jgi:hypothetical protein
MLIMASAASVSKNHLACCVEEQGFIIMLSCAHCTCLNKHCVKSPDSDCCGECICCGGVKCEEAPLPSTAAWSHLIQAQHSLCEEEETALNKLLHLCKQDCLLEKHAGDFLQHDIKEISELEELNYAEEKN